MAARRITYLVLLVLAAALHLVYGQYLTHIMVLFLLCVPVLSLLLSIPAALSARVELIGGEDVIRNRRSSVRLKGGSVAAFPPEAWSITVESHNVFTGKKPPLQKLRFEGEKLFEETFSPDTSQLGSIRYTIKRAFILDYLGLIPIPVRKGGSVSITVMPDKEAPEPVPDILTLSSRGLKPKPQGFAEEHEHRPYREGDALNLIHWKLSRKYNELIVREPQEVVRKDVVLSIQPPARYEAHRSVLEQLSYLDDMLEENKIPYRLQYGHKPRMIYSPNDYEDFVRGVLSEPMTNEIRSCPEVGGDALVYRIEPGKGANL